MLFFVALLQIGNFSYSLFDNPGKNCPEGNFSRLCGMDAAPAGGPDSYTKPNNRLLEKSDFQLKPQKNNNIFYSASAFFP